MKALFASLLCLVLTATQTFAIKGGPPYPANTNLIGSFGGVMQGVFDPTNPGSSNSIGVYSIGVPQNGNATGPFVMFARGRVFSEVAEVSAGLSINSCFTPLFYGKMAVPPFFWQA